ncbi:LLM class flavin-dependent oxidoreductase [Streptomyces sp. Inha503]|uniref:LLM class flavin-dependent oxidoreductase n=1 Tax=Streptomyces sp. Inha503 TaxID=3383314 RepID=UPI00399F36E1
MDFILMSEGDTPVGLTHEHRYRELVEEVLLAERVGFDAFGSSDHALRVAERVATEDILSNGRVELGTGRGNTTLALRAFEVDPSENKSQWREGVELIRRAFLDAPFLVHGAVR